MLTVLTVTLLAAPFATPPATAQAGLDFNLRDAAGRSHRLADFGKAPAVVVVFVGAQCPVVKLYAPRLTELHKTYAGKGVAWIAIGSNQQDTVADLHRFARDHALPFPVVKDTGNLVADRYGAERTPEVFVLDRDRKIAYRGRIDDQWAVGVHKAKQSSPDLAEALDAVLAGRAPPTPKTAAAGCPISRVERPAAVISDITYCRDIAPLVQTHCQACHRPGQAGPFSLLTFEDARNWAGAIRENVAAGRMPPWSVDPHSLPLANDPSLSTALKSKLFAWIDAGCPEGDPRDLPPERTFPTGWSIPTPDRIVSMPKPFTVPADGVVEYQYICVDPGFREDKWIQAAEIQPGNAAVVHHCNVFLQPPGLKDPKAIGEQGALGSVCFTQLAPGTPPMVLAPGTAKRVPAGWKFVFVVHYQPIGSVQTDQTRLGLVFADPKTVRQEVATRLMYESEMRIPPHAPDFTTSQTWAVHRDIVLLSFFPHMHLRGKSFRYDLIHPDGREQMLLSVPRYDFNWQHRYLLAEPLRIPAGSQIRCSAVYDNSKNNPNNPDPGAEVRAGSQSTDEMFNGFFDVVLADEDLLRPPTWSEWTWKKLEVIGDRPGIAVLAVVFGGIFLGRRRIGAMLRK